MFSDMRARFVFAVLPLLACAPSASSQPANKPLNKPERALPLEAQPEGAANAPSTAPLSEPAQAVDTDALCEVAKEGGPCPPEAGFCVLDWGEPGGWSEALW